MTDLSPTPSQTIGPFFHLGMQFHGDADLVPAGHANAIRLTGRILDGDGEPVPDALVEVWQAAPDGSVPREQGSLRRDNWTFTGWGRSDTDATGRFTFSTLAPGRVDGCTARWFSLVVFARGLLHGLFTRAYLPDDNLADDPLLSSLTPERRATVVAERDTAGYVFDIRLQGGGETVFLQFAGHGEGAHVDV